LKDGRLHGAEFIPVVIDEGEPGPDFPQKRGYPSIAQGGEATAILEAVAKASRGYGTEIEVIGERGSLRNLHNGAQ
jgi:hypothetical protein